MMNPYRKTQGSLWSETVRTALMLSSAALFSATALSIVGWHGALLNWASSDTAHSALLALAVVVDAVLILSLIGLAAHRTGPLMTRVPVSQGGRSARPRRR